MEYTGYDLETAKASVGKGWSKLLEVVFDAKPDDTVICQVKEKYGALRIYTNGSTEEFLDLLSTAEWMSENICEQCGKAGQILRHGWWKTMCPNCKENK